MSELIIEMSPEAYYWALKTGVLCEPVTFLWFLTEDDLWEMSERMGDDG